MVIPAGKYLVSDSSQDHLINKYAIYGCLCLELKTMKERARVAPAVNYTVESTFLEDQR